LDFKPCVRIKSKIDRTISEADSTWFILLTNNSNHRHFNKDYREKPYSGDPFKCRILVNSSLTITIAEGPLFEHTSQREFMLTIAPFCSVS